MTVVCTQYTRECLVWLDTPQHKVKRQIRRQPFAITSGKYQEVLDRHLSKGKRKACIRRNSRKEDELPKHAS
jgi:hypothetical protein